MRLSGLSYPVPDRQTFKFAAKVMTNNASKAKLPGNYSPKCWGLLARYGASLETTQSRLTACGLSGPRGFKSHSQRHKAQ